MITMNWHKFRPALRRALRFADDRRPIVVARAGFAGSARGQSRVRRRR